MIEEEDAAYACCSFGIGRWYWAVWANESEAMAGAKPLAGGYEKTGGAAEKKAVEVAGPGAKRLPSKWASRSKRGGAARPDEAGNREKPKSRLGRRVGAPARANPPARPAFLYLASESDDADSRGEVVIVRHRIVRRTARKIFVDREPFPDEQGLEGEGEGEPSTPDGPKVRTLAVDRETLRREGKAPHLGARFYASEDEAVRDVHALLTARHGWCAALGVEFPCSPETIKSAYRRLSRANHPDAGGGSAEFRAVEQAYREALDYFSSTDSTG